MTKGIPIEATALLAREFPEQLFPYIGALALQQAADYLRRPGISVVQDARLALRAGRVTAMHDPTEGGLAGALWELAEASGNNLLIDTASILISQLSQRICSIFDLDPLATLASGSLLLTTFPEDAAAIMRTLKAAGIACREIGRVEEGPGEVMCIKNGVKGLLPRPTRDEITKVYERKTA
jgi:hydrogenase maturation factor